MDEYEQIEDTDIVLERKNWGYVISLNASRVGSAVKLAVGQYVVTFRTNSGYVVVDVIADEPTVKLYLRVNAGYITGNAWDNEKE